MKGGHRPVRSRWRCLALGGILMVAGLSRSGPATLPVADWEHDVDVLRETPGLLRLHTFHEVGEVRPNLAGPESPLRFRSEDGSLPSPCDGRVEGCSAVLLDAQCFEGAPVPPAAGLTVSVWIKPSGMGARRGNDQVANGMVVCNGTGYYDGWRLAVFDWNSRKPTFEIGRPEGAVGVTAQDPLLVDEWNHIAATWDGARVRLHVNGTLSADEPYAGTPVAPQSGLRVGYAGFGVGSMRMAVDEMAVFDRALPEVVALFPETMRKFFFAPDGDSLPAWRAATPARSDSRAIPGAEWFVAPDGDDANPGTLDRPFATPERARDAVRVWRKSVPWPAGGVAIQLRGGTYRWNKTFRLDAEDSGLPGAPVVYRSYRGEQAILDGGLRITDLRAVESLELLERLPPESREAVRVAVLEPSERSVSPQRPAYGCGVDNEVVRDLYEDGQPLPIARWPEGGTLAIGGVLDEGTFLFACPTPRMARWTQAQGAMASGYWKYLWADATVPVAAFDPAAGTIRLARQPGYGLEAGRPFYVLNLMEELDRPGEWVLDASSGQLLVWPRTPKGASGLVLSHLDGPFVVLQGCAHVALEGLVLQHGQHHGLVLEGGTDLRVEGCGVRRFGGAGIVAADTDNLTLRRNHVETLGHAGLRLRSGDRKAMRSGGLVVEGNEVSGFGRHTRTYTPALLLEGCGARVSHNAFHHGPSSALRVEGNDHVIEFNDIHHVVQESDDQGALDMWRDPTYRGVVIRFNRWADIGGGDAPCGQGGIRLDDAISGVHIYGNRFERASRGNFGGVQIHGGKDNRVEWNLFVDCRIAVSFSPWEQARWEQFLQGDELRPLLHETFDIRSPAALAKYPALTTLPESANANLVERNVIVGAREPYHNPHANTRIRGNVRFATLDEVRPDRSPFDPKGLPPVTAIGPGGLVRD